MKVVQLKSYQLLKQRKNQELAYRNQLLSMDKLALLQELLRYHEAFTHNPLDLNATIRGQHLMEVLEARAELRELQELAQEFKAKLNIRLYEQIQALT